MNHTPYIERTYRKYDHVLERYAEHIFCPISSAQDVYALETMEHYRNPPAVSEMEPIKPGTEWGCEYGNLWLCTEFTVPEEADGKTLCAYVDAQAAKILCFKNGEPAGIINSKNQFLVLSPDHVYCRQCKSRGENIPCF